MSIGRFRLSDNAMANIYLGLTVAGVNTLIAIGLVAYLLRRKPGGRLLCDTESGREASLAKSIILLFHGAPVFAGGSIALIARSTTGWFKVWGASMQHAPARGCFAQVLLGYLYSGADFS